MSDLRGESRTGSEPFNTAHFTSVGIPVAAYDSEGANGRDGQGIELVRLCPTGGMFFPFSRELTGTCTEKFPHCEEANQ